MSEANQERYVAVLFSFLNPLTCFEGTSDETKAIRKCVVPDGSGNVACPNGFDCHVCDSDMCNTGSVTKVTWVSVIGVFLAVLHMY